MNTKQHWGRRRSGWFRRLAILGLTGALAASVFAYPVSEGRKTITLNDGTVVNLIMDSESKASGAPIGSKLTHRYLMTLAGRGGGHQFYYLPTNLRLSQRPDGVPEFLFLKFTSEKRESEGGVQGALMHFLMEYGLTVQQENELKQKLAATGDTLLGAMQMKPDGDSGTFLITSATLKDETMTKSLVTSGKAPLLPGQKVAAAARLTSNGAQLMAATLDKTSSIADCSITFNLAYQVVSPAIKGTATYSSTTFQQSKEKIKKEWESTHETTGRFLGFLWETSGEDTMTYKERRELTEILQKYKVVDIKFIELEQDARVDKIRDAVLQLFMNSFFQEDKASPEQMMESSKEQPKPDDGPAQQGNHFKSNIYRAKSSTFTENKSWNFNYSIPMTYPYPMTGNLMSWYNGVRDNPKCVASVNLNDPFFTHRDINFILDLDAKEIFEDTINYVTINIKKNRSSGRPFEDHRTIDAKYLKDKGVAAMVTYARGEDKNPEVYQYQVQWSLKGGNVFPESPSWNTGSWEGVTLAPPVRPLIVELEGDLDALKAKDITRVTAEVHISQFGKEDSELIQLPVGGAVALINKKMFTDRDMPKYAYRLVFNHKTAGKLVGPWVKDQSDGYIFAAIPENLLTEQAFKDRAANLASGLLEKVLDKLGGALGGN